ncbi:MAG TPA: uracil-DNA glycosylase [Thermoanaerobaculia bacterium]|jgi:DNA polymerase
MNPDLLHELHLLRDFGFTHLDLTAPPRVPSAEAAAAPLETAGDDDPWQSLVNATHNCNACRLAGTRKNVVFGVGNPNADLMFVGEAPGRDEDEQGEPFVGRAGQLLTDIIKAMKLTRDDVYIANVVKCRPPENRNPEPDELDECRPFIRRQIELIQPKVIVALGKIGLQSLTEKNYAISAVRGQWLDYDGIKLMPTYHPAYLLRTPAAKKDVWNDMKKVMAELGISL